MAWRIWGIAIGSVGYAFLFAIDWRVVIGVALVSISNFMSEHR